MFAVIESGGKQHRVAEGDVVKLESVKATRGNLYEAGDAVKFERVLLMSDENRLLTGAPHVKGGVVEGEVLSHGRGEKIRVWKFKRRKNYLRRQGHRQSFSEVRITKIKLPKKGA